MNSHSVWQRNFLRGLFSFIHPRGVNLLLILLFLSNQSMFLTQSPITLENKIIHPESAVLNPSNLDALVEPSPSINKTRDFPALLSGAKELSEYRTSSSAIYQVADKQYAALMSTEPIHYQDTEGKWQVSDPSFIQADDSYIVVQNAIQSRVGRQEAWLSAAIGEIAFSWEAHSLVAVPPNGKAIMLSEALLEPQEFAILNASNQVLTYTNGWDDPSLEEQLISTSESLEHVLVLNQAPAPQKEALQSLELQATLELFPGASLWADDQPIQNENQPVQTLQVRKEDGTPVLVFEPVLAFEKNNPSQSILGNYSVSPGPAPNSWTIGLRTPWSWWTDPQRSYPVVLDPTMKVVKSTGYADGMAWVRSTGLKDYSMGGIRLGAHLPDWNTETRGYIQFNSLPALISHHPSPIQVKQATLIVTPSLPGEAMPIYTNSPVDWEHKVIEKKTDLYYLGACPNDPSCTNQFSIHDDRLLTTASYNWDNSPLGVKLDTKPLKAGPASGTTQTYPTEFDVTNQIQNWYDNWYKTQVNRPAPTFMLQFVKPSGYTTICPQAGPYTFGYNNKAQLNTSYTEVPNCIWFDLPAGSIQLLVEYDELPLTIGDNLLNTPGVPSYLDDVFEDTDHQYDLGIQAGSPVWRMVAARGNHDYIEDDPGTPARVGLELVDYSPNEGQPSLTSAASQGPDKTTFIAIDDHHASTISVADLRVNVTSSSENDFQIDLDRNYRIEYIEAFATNLTYSAWTSVPINFSADRLAEMVEFQFNEGDNVLIKADLSPALEIVLLEPGDGSTKQGAVIGADDNRVNRGFQPVGDALRSLSIGNIPKTGSWSLAVINQERPFHDSLRPDYPALYLGSIEILVCAKGSIPSVKFQSQGINCQPLKLPDNSPPPSKVMPFEAGGNLIIHSEGGFVNNPSPGVDWCTTNEGAGAPIIESSASSIYGTYIFVGQGSVCRQAGQLITTPESGVGLAVPVHNFNPADKRGKYAPGFIYGDTGFYPLPSGMQDGIVVMAANGDLAPLANTRRNVLPFDQYWKSQFSLTPNSERIAISDLRAHASGVLSARIMVEVDQPVYEISWTIDWVLYPNMDTSVPAKPAYTFLSDITQMMPLPPVIQLASLEVRLVEGNTADGLLPILDSFLTTSGPNSYQFRATGARITAPASLGGATALGQALVQPPGRPRQPENQVSCKEGEESRSCFDLRRVNTSNGYDWLNGDGEKSVKPWELPDIHIEDQAGSVLISQQGQLSIFSSDHPQAANAIGQTFSFDTWEATVVIDHAACTPGGPITSVIRGVGYIALPSLGGDGGLAPPWIKMEFKLCETKFQEATLTLAIPEPGIPVGSTGVGVNLIGGTVTVGPNSTQIKLTVGFQTMDQYILTHGKGTVTINTEGMFSLQAQGKLVGIVNAKTLKLDVAWNPSGCFICWRAGVHQFLIRELWDAWLDWARLAKQICLAAG